MDETVRRSGVGLCAILLVTLAGCAGAPQRAATPELVCVESPAASDTRVHATPYDAGLPRRGQWRDGFDLADFDRDGHLDLVHGAPRKGLAKPVIFRGDGRGAFRFWEAAHFPPLPYDYGDVAAADLNGDGETDLALGVHLRGLVTLIHEGGGHFAPWGEGLRLVAPQDSVGETVFSSRRIALGDWNGDGRVDLVAVNEGPAMVATERASDDAVRVHLNRGGFWEALSPAPRVAGFGSALALGDLDGNGAADAVWGPQSVGVRELRLQADADAIGAVDLRSVPERSAVGAVLLEDVDGDGRDEALLSVRALVGTGFCNALLRVDIEPDGSESAQWLWAAPSLDGIVALSAGDIDGDRRVDAVALRRDGALMFFVGTRGGLAPDLRLDAPVAYAGCQGAAIRLVDLDGDAKLELIATYAGDDAGPEGDACPSRGGFQAWRLDGG